MRGYVETPPPAVLAGTVTCLWARAPDPPAAHAAAATGALVLPDGCVDLLWHAGRLLVAGPDTVAQRAAPGTGTTVGVCLRPGAARTLGVPASTLRDARVDAEDLWGAPGARLADAVAHAADDDARLGLLTRAIAGRIAGVPPPDPLVAWAAARVGRGPVAVAELAREAALSERQLRRRFDEHVGYGPRTLHRVLRLQRLLDRAVARPAEGLAALAAHGGYADQPHLAREVRALAGTTAAALVASRRPDAAGTSKTAGPAAGSMAA